MGEQSGIVAGRGGYDVTAGGKVDLTGGDLLFLPTVAELASSGVGQTRSSSEHPKA